MTPPQETGPKVILLLHMTFVPCGDHNYRVWWIPAHPFRRRWRDDGTDRRDEIPHNIPLLILRFNDNNNTNTSSLKNSFVWLGDASNHRHPILQPKRTLLTITPPNLGASNKTPNCFSSTDEPHWENATLEPTNCVTFRDELRSEEFQGWWQNLFTGSFLFHVQTKATPPTSLSLSPPPTNARHPFVLGTTVKNPDWTRYRAWAKEQHERLMKCGIGSHRWGSSTPWEPVNWYKTAF